MSPQVFSSFFCVLILSNKEFSLVATQSREFIFGKSSESFSPHFSFLAYRTLTYINRKSFLVYRSFKIIMCIASYFSQIAIDFSHDTVIFKYQLLNFLFPSLRHPLHI